MSERIEAILVEKETAALLRYDSDSRFPAISWSISPTWIPGYALEFTTSFARADQCSFQLELSKSPHTGHANFYFTRQVKI